ncbi:type II secretion system secretin GspD [Bordetella sp. 02P26C-1]|uniref:type II secretion system secretin GspD n=1 Tax=Bordetella sp. 02P26C-1 TaxID=2683195 RepID=UPI001F009957|nr:type II secretion system secretin GspD [Bordetella sp. 02P26C-1]
MEHSSAALPTYTGLRLAFMLAMAGAIAGCAAPSGTVGDNKETTPLIVYTSTGSAWREVPATPTEPAPNRSRADTPPRRSYEPAPPRSVRPQAMAPSSPGTSAGAADGDTMLNFNDVDLQSVIRALAHFTGRNFVVDPRVKGKLTLVSEQPVNRATAYSMLLSALRMQGYSVVESDGVTRVVPEAEAKVQGMSVTSGPTTAPQPHSGELITRVFQLRYENAANLMPVLRPMIAPNNAINVYPANNTLVITDYADNLSRIADVIASIDTPDSFSTDIVPVQHGIASDVAGLVSQMLNAPGSPRGSQPISVVADPRSNSILLRASSPEKLAQARTLIYRIDSPDTRAGNLHVVYLRNAQASQLAEVLRGVLSGQNAERGAQSGEIAMNPATSGSPSSPAPTSMAGLDRNASLSDSGSSLANMGMESSVSTRPVAFTAGGATVQADPTTNTLLISAPPPLYRSLREVIDQLDQRRAQVLVESLIVEVTDENKAMFGVQWMTGGNGLGSDGSTFLGGTNWDGSGLNPNGATTIDALAQGLTLGVVKGSVNVLGKEIINLSVLARALESTGGANILSTPNLLTLDNEAASIMVGRTVPFVTGRYTTSGDGASNPFQTVSREDVGLTLRIRPQISEGGTVKLALYQEVSSIDTAASTTAGGLVTRKRALETNVLVDDSQIIVLGGLIEDSIADTTNAVPILSKIPLLGSLFRYESRSRTKTNLMVFLRPHILRSSQDNASITLDRYNHMRAMQNGLPERSTWFAPNLGSSVLPEITRNPGTGLLDLRSEDAAPATPPEPAVKVQPIPPVSANVPRAANGSEPL